MGEVRRQQFADALRDAIAARGLSLDRVRAHLVTYGHDVSVATLSYWQTGRSVPVRRASLQALGALETILQVPRGTLASKLPSQQGRRTLPQVSHPVGPHLAPTGVNRITAAFGIGFHEGYEAISQEQTVHVNASRECSGISVDTVVMATRDGLDRLLVGYRTDIPGVLIEVSAVEGCRIGRTATVLTETLTVTEVMLDQPLRSGEAYRYQTLARHDTPGVVIRDWDRTHLEPIRTTTLTLSFCPADPPQCWVYVGPTTDDPAYEPVRVTGDEFTATVHDFGPGLFAMRWAWPEEPESFIQPMRRPAED